MKVPKALSALLFAIFMLVYGIGHFVDIPSADLILAVLAIAVGVLKFMGK